MKKLVIVLFLITIIFPVAGSAKKEGDKLLGTYSVEGYRPGTSTSGTPSYEGTLDVSQSGGAYILYWNLDGDKSRKGVGIYTDGILSVGYKDGVVSYTVKDDQLKGVWSTMSGGPFGFELCKRQSK